MLPVYVMVCSAGKAFTAFVVGAYVSYSLCVALLSCAVAFAVSDGVGTPFI